MISSILGFAAPFIIAIIRGLISNKAVKAERKRKYMKYIEYWEQHRITPTQHGDDIAEHLKDGVDK